MGFVAASPLSSDVTQVDSEAIENAVRVLRQSSERASSWLIDRIDSAGMPTGAAERNSWWRVPWALAIAGHRDEAAAVLGWAERVALTDRGDFRTGPYGGDSPNTPVYWLSHLAIAAHLLDRFDLGEALVETIRTYVNPETGGVRLWRDPAAAKVEDWLLTSQVGLVSVLYGKSELREETYAWFSRVWKAQPLLEEGVLLTSWSDQGLITDRDAAGATGYVDMSAPLQMYFQPGGAAAFIAEYAAQTRDLAAVDFARELLMLNLSGTLEQVTDERSVHVCKFAWGAAELLGIDSRFDWTPSVVRMAAWFDQRQAADGSWSPSSFTLSAPPTDLDKMWKTAEHLMEVEKMRLALIGRDRRPAWAQQ